MFRRTYGHIRDILTPEKIRSLRLENRNKFLKLNPNIQQIKTVDLRPKMPPVFDQGSIGSCTVHATVAAYSYLKPRFLMMSKLFLYYNSRALNEKKIDTGCQISDVILSIQNTGVCIEILWPYITTRFNVEPPIYCYLNCEKPQDIKVNRINQNLNDIKNSLIEEIPVIFGFQVYSYFESYSIYKKGILNLPKKGEKYLGKHCVLIVGFDDNKKMFLIRNSWSTKWGLEGYFYMSYDYVLNPNLSFDFWTIKILNL